MAIKIVQDKISIKELKEIAKNQFGDLVKAVVDIEQKIMAVGGELHADEEIALVENKKTKREFAWGVNLYPEKSREEWIEFDSMINLKPQHQNRSRGVDNAATQKKIQKIINKLVDD